MYLFPRVVNGNGPRMSNATISPGLEGSGSEINGHREGRLEVFDDWHTIQCLRNQHTLSLMPIQK